MALIIKATEGKKINISGTNIEIPEVYARLEFVARANGLSIEIAIATYTNKTTFEQGKPVFTDLPNGNVNAHIEANEQQSLETSHKYAKLAFEQLGYDVVIDLV